MAKEFHSLSEDDTIDFRKKIGVPMYRGLRYIKNFISPIEEQTIFDVISYKIVDVYQPSETYSLLLTLDNGENVRILADYFSEMQTSSTNVKGERLEEFPETYTVYDIETTGKNYQTAEIIEIGAVKYDKGKEIDSFNVLVNIEPNKIPKKVKELTGITDELLSEQGIGLKEAIESFIQFIGDSILLGYNITTFDNYAIAQACDKYQIDFSNNFVDAYYLARKNLKDIENHKLSTVAEHYGLSTEGAHRALFDCRMTNSIYIEIAKLEGIKIIEGEEYEIVHTSEDGYKKNIETMLDNLIEEWSLPVNSIRLVKQMNKNEGEYQIQIYEPEYPPPRDKEPSYTIISVLPIKEGHNRVDQGKLNIHVLRWMTKHIQIPESAEILGGDAGEYIIVRISQDDANVIPFIKQVVEYRLKTYMSAQSSFACCSQFEQCSDAKRCVHENRLYSTACSYRRNLEAGRIFYGKNRNID